MDKQEKIATLNIRLRTKTNKIKTQHERHFKQQLLKRQVLRMLRKGLWKVISCPNKHIYDNLTRFIVF